MRKPIRTVKKSAAKSSVSRKTLRSAVKKSSGSKKGVTLAAKTKSRAANETASKAERSGKTVKRDVITGGFIAAKNDLIREYVRQPSIIRP